MRLRWFPLLLALIVIAPARAASTPSGSFTLSPAPYLEGGTISFTFGKIHAPRSYEVTLGVWCVLPDGSEIPWGNVHNPYIYEFNSFGQTLSGLTVSLYLPLYGTGYSCTAELISAQWFKGQVLQAWTLDKKQFQVSV